MASAVRVLLLLLLAAGPAAAKVTIAHNGYSGVLVAISQDVPQERGQQIVDDVKVMFTEGSRALYTATEKRAYFKNVSILIPMSWTNFTIDRTAFSETYEEADIRVAPANPAYGDNPYTLQPGGCGEPGRYIHVTPDYLKNDLDASSPYGPTGKVLTHEWAHLRYGVFEEYGYPGDDIYPLFYYAQDATGESHLVPNTCSNTRLRGYEIDVKTQGDCNINRTTGLPDINCMFFPYDNNNATTSLMAFTYLDSVEHFCDNNTAKQHHRDAPTKQNFRCDQKSVWEVMRENDDFSGGRNPPANLKPEDIVPTFEVVQPSNARFIMVLDTSGSMQSTKTGLLGDGHRIARLHSAATKWIKYELQNGTWVSIVTFTDVGVLQTDFRQIVDDASRDAIASYVPSSATGGTCICNGVQLALKTLRRAIDSGGVMILMTDGDENTNCINPDTDQTWDLTDLYDPVVAAEVRVITMAFGTSADSRLEKFAEISGGRTYFISDSKASLDLDQAFQGCLTYQPDITVETEKDIVLFQQHFAGSAVKIFSGMFSIDPTTGRDFVFKLEYDDSSTSQAIDKVQLVSPSGHVYTNISYHQNENFGTLKLNLAEEGDWQFSVSFSTKKSSDVVITTTSKARSRDVRPLMVECWISTTGDVTVSASTRLAVLAKVRQGDNAVLSATVMAHVSTPSSSSGVVDLQLFDNGVAADAVGNDGIYSKYFAQFAGKGRYSVVCEVKNDGNAVINEGFSASAVMPVPNKAGASWCCGSSSPVGNTRPTGNFTRTMSAGAFQVKNAADGSVLPPSQVTDLVMRQRNSSGEEVTVSWTAPGADLDQGTADHYVFKWSNVSGDLSPAMFDSHGVTVNDSLVPAPAAHGTVQTLHLPVPSDVSAIYLAMKAVDVQGHWSVVSNTAILFVGALPPRPSDDGGLSPGAIAGIVVAALVVLVAAVVGALFVRHRKRVYNV